MTRLKEVKGKLARAWLLGSMCALVSACAGSTANLTSPEGTVIAHRGASSEAPENTLAAYRLAYAQGAQAAECDVRMSADGQVVLMHDAKVNRTTDGKGRVEDFTASELAQLDAGSWLDESFAGEGVPTLDAVLDEFGASLTLFVELKGGEDLVAHVTETLEGRPSAVRKNVVLLSFKGSLLVEAQRRMPDVPTLLLRDGPGSGRVSVRRAEAFHVGAVGLADGGVRRGTVRRLHDAGVEVFVYTVDDRRRAKQLAGWGVDGIITNTPSRMGGTSVFLRGRRALSSAGR